MSTNKFVRCLSSILVFSTFAFAAQTATATSDSATLTKGSASCAQTGYLGPSSVGSYSPTGLTGGKTVIAIFDYLAINALSICPGQPDGFWSAIYVGGFSSDPGSGWLNSVTCNGVTRTGSGASYSYSNGWANWNFGNIFNFATMSNGATTSCTVDHS